MLNKGLFTLFFTLIFTIASASLFKQVDSNGSSVQFVFKQMGVASTGLFKQFGSTLQFDPHDMTNSKIEFIIELNSIDTGVPGGDDEVKGKNWLATQQFPQARFISQRISATGSNRFSALGELTIKGRRQLVTVPFQLNANVVDGQFSFKRLAFNIGEGEWSDTSVVADEVQVKFHLNLK